MGKAGLDTKRQSEARSRAQYLHASIVAVVFGIRVDTYM